MQTNTEDDKKLQIMELFGPTIQGEGLMSGTITHFLRTGGCPLKCTWCDSMFAVDPKQILEHRTMMSTWEIIDAILSMPYAPYITLTGGDPAIQTRLGDIIPALNDANIRVAIETQGMYFPNWLEACDVITFSPKGPSSGNIVDIPPLSNWLWQNGVRRKNQVCIKVVVFDESDFSYAMDVYDAIPYNLYDSFYFTAGTPPFEEGFPPAERRLDVVHNQMLVAEMLLKTSQTIRFNDKVHVGCQQHVLLWPSVDKGA